MAEIGKFIFTNEGRRMLVAQNGGIHFAVMGAILLTRGFLIIMPPYHSSSEAGIFWSLISL